MEEKNLVLEILVFRKGKIEVLDHKNISNLQHLLTTRRNIYDILAFTYRQVWTSTDTEQNILFKQWVFKYLHSHDSLIQTYWFQEFMYESFID